TAVDPIPQANHPLLSLVSGSLAPGDYFAQVAWRNASGEEGGPSELTAIEVTSGKTFRVQAVNAPANAVWWNVYAGTTPDVLFLQNPAPIAPGGAWIAPDAGLLIGGPQPGTGQEPTFLSPAPRILLRG